MKKVIITIALFCMMLTSGIILVGCVDPPYYTFEVQKDEQTDPLVEITVKEVNETLSLDADGTYHVAPEANLRVDISATKQGVDMSEFVLKIGEETKSIILDQSYDINSADKLHYGYFSLPKVKSHNVLAATGAKEIESTFTFEVKDIEDEDVIKKLKMATVKLSYENNSQFENLYDLVVTNGNQPFTRKYSNLQSDTNPYTTFLLKFEGVSPFDLSTVPFTLKTETNAVQDIKSLKVLNGVYYINLGTLGYSKSYKIVVDFKNMPYKAYQVQLPESNLVYSTALQSNTITYVQGTTLTVTKLMDSSKVNYENMKVYINSHELDVLTTIDNTVVYTIPEGLSPMLTGGTTAFKINVEGIEYLVDTYSVSLDKQFPAGTLSPIFRTDMFVADAQGNNLATWKEDSVAFEGDKIAIKWEYEYSDTYGKYQSAFDLYDFNLYNKDTKVFNLKEVLAGKTADAKIELGTGYVLKATYNEATNIFDEFQFEYDCTADAEFVFKDFVEDEKDINVLYSFTNDKVESVEYVIVDSLTSPMNSWKSLTKDVVSKETVKTGQFVVFRVVSTEAFGAYEFKILENGSTFSTDAGTALQISSGVLAGKYQTIYKYRISDIQFDELDFKFVSKGALA